MKIENRFEEKYRIIFNKSDVVAVRDNACAIRHYVAHCTQNKTQSGATMTIYILVAVLPTFLNNNLKLDWVLPSIEERKKNWKAIEPGWKWIFSFNAAALKNQFFHLLLPP